MFDTDEKSIMKDSLVKYVSYLQKRFFKDKNISEEDYHQQMNHIESIVEKLHLNDLYKL